MDCPHRDLAGERACQVENGEGGVAAVRTEDRGVSGLVVVRSPVDVGPPAVRLYKVDSVVPAAVPQRSGRRDLDPYGIEGRRRTGRFEHAVGHRAILFAERRERGLRSRREPDRQAGQRGRPREGICADQVFNASDVPSLRSLSDSHELVDRDCASFERLGGPTNVPNPARITKRKYLEVPNRLGFHLWSYGWQAHPCG